MLLGKGADEREAPIVKLVRGARVAFLVLAGIAVFVRLFAILNFDRNGGVTCIWLRSRPALEWLEASAAEPAASHAVSVTCGDENGVVGDDLLLWNARSGWWLLSTATLLLIVFERRLQRSARQIERHS